MPQSVNKTQSKWCINKHGASKIIDTFETYQPPIFPDTETESKAEMKRGQEAAAPGGGAGAPWPCHQVVWAPGPPSDIALPPIKCLYRENPESSSIHPRKVTQRCCHQRPILGDRSLYFGTLSG
jgi:hypothetical protein